jgi:AcrR family transcriptional regulator
MSLKKAEKHTALMQAALELFAEQGFHGSSTAQIAKRAGVASGTLFFYFNSKEALIHELFREILAKIEQRVLESFHAEVPVKERFLQTFSNLLRYFLENPQEFKFVEQYHFSPFSKQDDRADGESNPLRDILIQARQQKLIKDAPLLFLEAVAFGPIASLAKEHANHGTPVDEELVRLTIEACWDGLKRV